MTPSTLRRDSFSHAADFDAAWLALRAKHVTSTQVSALFGMSQRLTPYELWNIKAGTIADTFAATERTEWGLALQDSIAQKIAADNGWRIRRMDDYLYDADERIGSSFDFIILNAAEGRANLEIKNVDALVFRNEWREVDGLLEAPDHIEIQAQHQMEMLASDADYDDIRTTYIVALVGGNRAVTLRRDRYADVGLAIRQKVREFWQSIADNIPPPVTLPDDAAIVQQLYRLSDGSVVEADESLAAMVKSYHDACLAIRTAEETRDSIRAELLLRIGPAAKVLAGEFSLSATAIAEHPGTLVTQDMVGTCIGARRGYRRLQSYHKPPPNGQPS